ncbi:hypothetical protein QVD17_18383 [Tagetes erecta]|uniref:glycine--tRNA ligase n=1 Tax=Tagetes erecta TaxID=13708 RepID=A0AAD8KHN1_TARER|nr:hypothetical protein QVD17_18383 [Tagetes erecta]
MVNQKARDRNPCSNSKWSQDDRSVNFGYTSFDINNNNRRLKGRNYYLEHASVDHIQKHFDFFEAEARALLDLGLAIPAYDQLLKTSHAFNILGSRGFDGVTERAHYFGRMRRRSCS